MKKLKFIRKFGILVSQGLCETTSTERFNNPNCKCPTYPANLGPCKEHLEGIKGRCIYCDHLLTCIPKIYIPIHSLSSQM